MKRTSRVFAHSVFLIGMLFVSVACSSNEKAKVTSASTTTTEVLTTPATTAVLSTTTLETDADSDETNMDLFISYGKFGPSDADDPSEIRNGADFAASLFWAIAKDPQKAVVNPVGVIRAWPATNNHELVWEIVQTLFRWDGNPRDLKDVLVEPSSVRTLGTARVSLTITIFGEEGEIAKFAETIEALDDRWIVNTIHVLQVGGK